MGAVRTYKRLRLSNCVGALIALTVCFHLIAAPAVPAGVERQPVTIYVDDDYDAGTTGWGVDHFDTIQDGLDAAVNGTTVTIIVYAGTYVENVDFAGKAVTLRSADPTDPVVVAATIIDGNAADTCVTFDTGEGSDSVISGFTIRNGEATNGGGILCDGTSPTISYNAIEADTAFGQGAGIYGTESDATVTNNTLADNEHSDAVTFSNSSPTISSNTISDSPDGAGLYLMACTDATVSGNTITGNSDGGIIVVDSSSVVVSDNTVSFNDDFAGDGGGIFCSNSVVVSITDNDVSSNFAASQGGGICLDDGSEVTLTGNTIAHNDSTSSGGGLCVALDSSCTMYNNLVYENTTDGDGGALECSGSSDIDSTNDTVSLNRAFGGAGAVWCDGLSTVTVTNGLLWDNTGLDHVQIELTDTSIATFAYSDVDGGEFGVEVDTDSTLNWGSGNIDADPLFADAPGFDLRLSDGSPCIDAADGTEAPAADIDGILRYDDPATANTGTGTPAYADMGAHEFVGPTAALSIESQDPGSGISVTVAPDDIFGDGNGTTSFDRTYVEDTEVTLTAPDTVTTNVFYIWKKNGGDHDMEESTVVTADADDTYTAVYRPAPVTIYVDDDYTAATPDWGYDHFDNIQDALDQAMNGVTETIIVYAGTYTENINFGGKYVTLRSEDPADSAVVAATIIDGGAAGACVTFNSGEEATAVLSGFTIQNGYKEFGDGGGIYCVNASPTITDNVITGNEVTGGAFAPGYRSEDADRVGGGYGGGIFCSNADISVTGNTITGNTAERGAGVSFAGGTLRLTDCTITDNEATVDGGGVHTEGAGTATLRWNAIYGNSADDCGGGLTLTATTNTLENNLIYENTAADGGGGVWCHNGTSILTNNTITGNSATDGGGLLRGTGVRGDRNGTPATLTNCVFWSNAATGDGAQLFLESDGIVNVDYCDVEGGEAAVHVESGGALNWGSGNVDADPIFMGPASDDYTLAPNSPCIDSADGSAAPDTDFAGFPRHDDPVMPNDGVGAPWADMGAHEFQGTSAATLIVDNTDPGYSVLSGVWPVSTVKGGHYGPNYAWHGPGAGTDGVRWTPVLPAEGWYSVYGRWSASPNRSSRAVYSVTHADGTVTVTGEQTKNGSRWVPLGCFRFEAGSGGYVGLSDAADGHVVADAVMWVLGLDGLVVDNTDPGFDEVSGIWPTGTSTTGYYGPDYAFAAAGPDTDLVRWTPDLPAAGDYAVYTRWTSAPNRSVKAVYTVNYDGGATAATVDQQTAGGDWTLMGVFPFDAGTGGNVELAASPLGYVAADAVAWHECAGGGLIVDNVDTEFAVEGGLWPTSDYGGGYYGSNYAYETAGAETDLARWMPEIPAAGDYMVYARWAASSNRSERVAYDVNYDGGTAAVTVDQSKNGGKWCALGVFPFAAGEVGNVEMLERPDGLVVADAVMWAPEHIGLIVDNTDTEFTVQSGVWPTSDVTTGYYGPDYAYHETGVGTEFARWTPVIPRAGNYAVFARWTMRSNRSRKATYAIHHAGGDDAVTVNQRGFGGEWVRLATYFFDAGEVGYVELAASTDGSVVADAIMWVLDYERPLRGPRFRPSVEVEAEAGSDSNEPPLASAACLTEEPSVGARVVLSGAASFDPDESPELLAYRWTRLSGPEVKLSGATAVQCSFTPATAGVYVFELHVSDGEDFGTADLAVEVGG